MNKVKILADKNNNVVTISPNNPEYGWIFVEQLSHQLEAGWLKPVVRKARINGKVTDLLNVDYKAGQELPGQIVVLESLTPFDNENPDRDLKIAGKTGVICRYFDQPIYRQCYYTSNINSQDELINHTNRDEIRDVLTAQKMLDNLSLEEQKEAAL
jgi:hypothetical protein